MTPLCFIDTETTGVHPDRRVWEVAVIRRDDNGTQEHVWQILDVDLSNADPFGLNVGRFYERHGLYAETDAPIDLIPERIAARFIEEATRGAHLVGVVPSFDAGCLDPMLRRHALIPSWHYHLIDVEAMAVGWIAGRARGNNPVVGLDGKTIHIGPPWKSDELSRACGVEPPSDAERHTALGDARWAMRWYDAMTTGQVKATEAEEVS